MKNMADGGWRMANGGYFRFAVVLACAAAANTTMAQQYPNRPVRMVVGFPPGGGTDIVARIIQPKLSEYLGQSVVIENRAGATGTVAAGLVAKSPPDGYTIMMGHISVNAIAPSLFAKLPYDAGRDFAAITLAAAVPHLMVVHPALPARSVKQLIALAKARPDELSFPSAGNGSTPHLSGELFKLLTGTKMLHVPYKGTGQSIPDLLSGRHQVAFDTMPAASSYVRAGRMRPVAVTSAKRVQEFADVPTAEEAGVKGFVVTTWYGVFAPAGTPPAIVSRLHGDINKAMQAPGSRERLVEVGFDGTVTRTPEEFAAMVRDDIVRYAKVVKDAGLQID
jgi:tripartite-type tricarboxylate transporter receptor subunit TctC